MKSKDTLNNTNILQSCTNTYAQNIIFAIKFNFSNSMYGWSDKTAILKSNHASAGERESLNTNIGLSWSLCILVSDWLITVT